ncbi:GIY-YIG nuclease family protein [Geobacter sp. SVR]|uniref:GIY-YIG nuclease family protein n=1 Tax=Geobacter sp. SVR TaxID=2495594 RepID=UPI00143EFDFE|nr:GIY-YIG nuclease family protein [Geobacter sp. SVR]BCS52524.1 GIY-YIG domain-containing protein [Geobacter sp. SVR]GCF84039.1 GIY-YIG domain-containing protein [Geobacter sp. SVR]
MNWQVYIILGSDDSFYTGITTDIERRFRQHAAGRGARYFRGRRPVRVVYLEQGHSRISAARRECEIKAMNRKDKALLAARQASPAVLPEISCGGVA